MILLEDLKKQIKALYSKCLNCERKLDDNDLRKTITRCKKCMRKHEIFWCRSTQDFLKLFEGQT